MANILYSISLYKKYPGINSTPVMKKRNYTRLFLLGPALISMLLAEYSFLPPKNFIFSSYMVGHILLVLITAPLFVLSLPERSTGGGFVYGVSRRLTAIPWANWIIGMGIIWLWHIPSVFNALVFAEGRFGHGHLHFLAFLHSGSLLMAGILFCWPLTGPFTSHRLPPAEAILYLTSACLCCSMLGVLIEFATPGHYYSLNAASVITKIDQQWAGLILWVPCCILYLAGVIFLLRKWMGDGLWKSTDFYRRVPKRHARHAESDIAPAGQNRILRRHSGVVIPQLGVPETMDHLA
jgi:putative membrane protein